MFWEHSLIESHGVKNDNNDKVTDDYVFVFDLQGVYKSKLKVHFRLGKEQFRNEMRRLINLFCHGRCNYFVGLGQTVYIDLKKTRGVILNSRYVKLTKIHTVTGSLFCFCII